MMCHIQRWALKFVAVAALFTAIPVADAAAQVWTQARTIQRIDISTVASGAATYYLFPSTGTTWGPTGCTTATAFIYSDRVGAKELLAVAMQAKQMGKTALLYGTCVLSNAYFSIEAISVDQ